jgi:hypothetical protein
LPKPEVKNEKLKDYFREILIILQKMNLFRKKRFWINIGPAAIKRHRFSVTNTREQLFSSNMENVVNLFCWAAIAIIPSCCYQFTTAKRELTHVMKEYFLCINDICICNPDTDSQCPYWLHLKKEAWVQKGMNYMLVQGLIEHSRVLGGVSDVSRWFLENGMLLNPNKTEAVLFGTRAQRKKIDTFSGIDVAETRVAFSSTVKLLGVTLVEDLSFDRHVSDIVRGSSYHTRALRHIRPLINLPVARMVGEGVSHYVTVGLL